MPRAYAVSGTPVINLGAASEMGPGHSFAMDALNSWDARKRGEAQASAEQFMERIKPLSGRPDLVKQATDDFVSSNPDAAKYLKAYQQDLPMTDEQEIGRQTGDWTKKMLPMIEEALQNGTSISPHLLSALRPFISKNDKSMEPHEYDDVSQQFTYDNEGKVAPDYLRARLIKDKLERSPQEVAQSFDTQRGQDVGADSARYTADSSRKGVEYSADSRAGSERYAVDAKKPVYEAEVGKLGSQGKLYDARARSIDTNAPTDPELQQMTEHLKDLREQVKQTSIKARMSGSTAAAQAERASAQEMATSLANRVHMVEQMMAARRQKLGMGNIEDDGVPDSALSGQDGLVDTPGATHPGQNLPITPSTPTPQRQPLTTPRPTTPAARPTVQAPAGGIDRARKIITRSKLLELQQKKAGGQKVETSGWTVLDQ